MKKYVFLILVLAAVSCVSRRQSISVCIDGWGNDTVFVDHIDVDSWNRDTIKARDGRFKIIVLDSVPLTMVYRPCDKAYDFSGQPWAKMMHVAPCGKMRLRGTAQDEYVDYYVKKSELNAEIAEYERQMRPLKL